MNIKAIKFLLFATLFAVAMVSCDDDKNEDTDDEYIYYNLLVVPSQPSASGSAITRDMQWKTGDQVAALNLLYARDVETMTYDGSKFSGRMASVSSAGTIGYFYPKSVLEQTTSDTTTVHVDYQIQDGVTVMPYLAGEEAAIITSTGNAESELNMQCINAYATIAVNCNGALVNDIVHMEISAYSGKLYNKGDYELKRLTYTTLKEGNISVKSAGLNGVARIMMIPTDGVALAVTAVAADGRAYVGKMLKSSAVEAGGEYVFAFDCQLEEGSARIGDYFYSDYTRSSEYDETKTLVGIVYALTDYEGGDINPELSVSNHGRVMSVVDYGKAVWSFSATYVFDIPKIPNFGNVDGSNSQGFLPENAMEGTYHADADTKIDVKLDNLGRIVKWPNAGALSDFNGRHNTECSDTAVNRMPASFRASNFDKGGLSGWYLPSAGEMALISAQCSSGVMDNKEGFTPLSNFTYWTSTEHSAEKVWAVQPFNGRVVANYKTSTYMVRPVLQF